MTVLLKCRRAIVILFHLILAAASYNLAFLLRFDGVIPDDQFYVFRVTLPVAIVIKGVTLWYFRLYKGLWRYAGMDDLIHLVKATSLSTVLLVFSVVIFYGHGFPRSVFLIDWLTSISLFGGVRFSVRIVRELFHGKKNKKSSSIRTLIIGAGDSGGRG